MYVFGKKGGDGEVLRMARVIEEEMRVGERVVPWLEPSIELGDVQDREDGVESEKYGKEVVRRFMSFRDVIEVAFEIWSIVYSSSKLNSKYFVFS